MLIADHLESIMSEHGIPEEPVIDNGPQYRAKEFHDFVTIFGIKHTTSSPHHAQRNYFVERTVKKFKSNLKKSDEEEEDPYLGPLAYKPPIHQ